ncbi:MAG: ABC transporter permease subunit [Eubacteriales bacterium]|jgi:iron(III) transport system permease protein
MTRKNWELRLIFLLITALFISFLAAPIVILLGKSLWNGGFTLEFYHSVVSQKGFLPALGNSFTVASAAAIVATVLAFCMAYACHYTRLPRWSKQLISAIATLPMFLPTITYGFAIIYSFGKQGLLTRLLGSQFFDIYGFGGLLVGYVIYTIPVAFLLIHNTMDFVDKKTMIVSKVMGDRHLSTFWIAIFRPLLGTLAGAFIQAFFLCFTDFGIPASVGGGYEVIATLLYNQMLGGIPDFNRGAVIAMIMLIPSIGSICILQLLERFNIRYNRISNADLRKNPLRDVSWGALSTVISVAILSIFAVIFVVPLVEEWPYKTGFSLEHFISVFTDSELLTVYWHSLSMALLTALLGTLIAYGAALITARSSLGHGYKRTVESIALITNAIPGMVLGVAYLFLFSGTSLQNTLLLMILCNIVHYFSTPYLMMKNSLSKMNAGWETTAMLMGDSWIKTILRVVTPNAMSSLIQVFSYYFINSMVTISALIFIAGARTMVLTTMIKQLQYVNRFNEVFVLSLLILGTNLLAKAIFGWLANRKTSRSPRRG